MISEESITHIQQTVKSEVQSIRDDCASDQEFIDLFEVYLIPEQVLSKRPVEFRQQKERQQIVLAYDLDFYQHNPIAMSRGLEVGQETEALVYYYKAIIEEVAKFGATRLSDLVTIEHPAYGQIRLNQPSETKEISNEVIRINDDGKVCLRNLSAERFIGVIEFTDIEFSILNSEVGMTINCHHDYPDEQYTQSVEVCTEDVSTFNSKYSQQRCILELMSGKISPEAAFENLMKNICYPGTSLREYPLSTLIQQLGGTRTKDCFRLFRAGDIDRVVTLINEQCCNEVKGCVSGCRR